MTLPPDFGTIQLVKADRLLAARSYVQAFDIIVVALIVLSVLLVALALWLARDRRRMVVYLGLGTLIAFLIARLAINGIENAVLERDRPGRRGRRGPAPSSTPRSRTCGA